MIQPELSILVVSYNTRALTLACLGSVYDQTKSTSFEVIVVDNQSGDASADAIQSEYPHVRLILPDENLGFARANNLAAKHARGRWLLLLNPDTLIIESGIDNAMAFAGEQAGDVIVGGRTFFADGRLNANSCHGAPTLWSMVCKGTGLSSVFPRSKWLNPESLGRWKRDTVREVDAITGCFLLIRTEFWNRLGGFDEAFFMYGEDTDLCIRARNANGRCVICPSGTLIHYGGQSERVRADKMVRLFRAKAQLIDRHWSPATARAGVGLLGLWAWTRMAVLWMLRWVRPQVTASYGAWRDVWRRRTEYLDVDGSD